MGLTLDFGVPKSLLAFRHFGIFDWYWVLHLVRLGLILVVAFCVRSFKALALAISVCRMGQIRETSAGPLWL